jgi:Glycosyltransferase family 87
MINLFRRRIENYLLNLPLLAWILLGFLTTFILFFIIPIFLGPSLTMKFAAYVPIANPIGKDFRDIVSHSYTWFHSGTIPVILYPPFTLIFFTPFTFVSYETGYKILIGMILICCVLTTLIFPRWINHQKDIHAVEMLIMVTGLISYGFQFEIERGQWNLIAFSFSVASIYIFHKQPKYRWLAYLLFTISVQLKLFPAIFVFTLIEDFSDWKNNIKRIAGLGAINLLALFIFGINPVLKTIESLNKFSPSASSHFNLSLVSFTLFLFSKGVLPQKHITLWLTANEWLPQLLLFVLFGFCCLIICFQAYKKKATGFNPYIFLACFIGACIIPSVSFDYKLSMLPASVIISMPEILLNEEGKNQPLAILLAFIFSVAYSSMLYSYTNKPKILQNNFPALLLILIICTILSCIKSSKSIRNSKVDSKI